MARRRLARASIDIDEDRAGAEARDATSGCEEGVRRRDDCVAGADAECHENHQFGVGAAGRGDGLAHSDVVSDGLFERFGLRAENEGLGVADFLDGVEELGFQRSVLAAEIEERDGHGLAGFLGERGGVATGKSGLRLLLHLHLFLLRCGREKMKMKK
jgi:hypothetical protein